MERRFRVRLDELIDDAKVRPGLLRGMTPRLEQFLRPFAETLRSAEQRTNARHYVQGLLSDLGGKDVESIAYLHDRERQGLQKFIGQADWDHRPLLAELARQVGAELGDRAELGDEGAEELDHGPERAGGGLGSRRRFRRSIGCAGRRRRSSRGRAAGDSPVRVIRRPGTPRIHSGPARCARVRPSAAHE